MVKSEPQITPKQRQIAELKLSGLENKKIGQMIYPNAKPDSQAVLISRELKKPTVAQYYAEVLAQSKQQAIIKHGITWDTIIRTIKDGMTAEKTDRFTGEIFPDHTTRLGAARDAQKLLTSDKVTDTVQPTANNINTELAKLLSKDTSEVTLHEILIKQKEEKDKA